MSDAGQPGQDPQQPYQQQPPQQPPPQPAAGQPQPGQQPAQASSDGLDPKIGALLAYLLGWIGGLIMFLTQKNPEVKFHGAQSLAFNIALFILWIATTILGVILGTIGIGFLASILWFVLLLGGFALWIVLCIKGYNLEHFKLPVIGDMAEKFASN